MMLLDGTGKGYQMEIDKDNHAHVRAYSQDVAHLISHKDGLSFTWTIVPYNYAALDTIMLLRNDDSNRDLVITDIWAVSDAATDIIVHYTDGTPFLPAGVAVVGTNANRKSTRAALATAIGAETNNVQGNIALQLPLVAGNMIHIQTRGAVILGYNNSIAIDYPTVGTLAHAAIGGYYSDIEG